MRLFVGDLNGEHSFVLLQVPCQAPIKQQQVPPVSATLHPQGLPTLPFTVSVPVTASPSCTFSKLALHAKIPDISTERIYLQINPEENHSAVNCGLLPEYVQRRNWEEKLSPQPVGSRHQVSTPTAWESSLLVPARNS